jgi:D-sedoheptulose 7-phosphate isomerase
MDNIISKRMKESLEMIQKMREADFTGCLQAAAQSLLQTYRKGKRVLLAGNGGSAADAQHLAAELVARFFRERKGLPAEALNVNTSVITAVGNDYDFNRIFSRQIEANGSSGDLFIALSTSGNSPNIIEAIAVARQKGMTVLGFTGGNGGKMKTLCDVSLIIPSDITPHIQEGHIICGHILCEIAETLLADEGVI